MVPRRAPRVLSSAALGLAVLVAPLRAQWSSNPASNLAVCTHTGDQAVPKAAATGDGRTWIGWFDNTSGSYAVYVQLLVADGVEQLAPGGMLVSANPQGSSLVDWDLDADSAGNCVLVFTDTRAGSDLDVYAYRIDPAGTFLWGTNGVRLSSNADFEPSPRVVETSDGSFVFAWARIPSGTATGSIRVQKLDPAGNPQYVADGFAIDGLTNEKPAFCDVVAADGGSYVVQWLRNTATFASPRHVYARKFDAAGSALWPSAVAVYDEASVPIGYYPVVQTDGAGGAVFAWHRSLANTFDCLVQRLDTNGAEVFPHNGVIASTEAGRQEFSPGLAYLPASGDMIVAYDKRNAGQSQWGVGAQRISASGTRLWTDSGVELLPVDGTVESFVRCVPYGDGAVVACFDQPNTPLLQHRVIGFRVDGSGASTWGAAPVLLSSVLASKDDLELVVDGSGMARAIWHDERTDGGDVYAQNVNADGTIGDPATCTATPYCVGAPNSAGPGASIGMSGSTSVGLNGFTLTASGCPPSVSAFFVFGSAQVQVPLGDGFRCIGGTIKRLQPAVPTSPSGTISRPVDFTQPPPVGGAGSITPGSTWSFQLYYRDALGPGGTGGNGFNLSDGLSATFCP